MSALRVQQAVVETWIPRVLEVREQLGVSVKIPTEGRIVVSACLAGVACTHEAEAKTREWAVQLVASGRAVLVCPEVAGGLPIPRPAAEIVDGDGADVVAGRARVVSEEGSDVTENYLAGARVAVEAARGAGARLAVLKARSPSCGCGEIYGGGFIKNVREGDGVAAAMLKGEGVEVVSDDEVE
jgi:uncharacterized protein YbbK (DUF523 family)